MSDQTLAKALEGLFEATREVSFKIRTASCDSTMCFNTLQQDEQLAIDILADTVMAECLRDTGCVSTVSSSAEPFEMPVGGSGFSVAFDPLDSSSSVDVNFAVGASWGVWSGDRLVGVSGRQVVAAGLSTFGPRTSMLVATSDADKVFEFVLVSSPGGTWEWQQSNVFQGMSEDKPYRRAIFAPGNLRATEENPGYRKLIDYYLKERYHLRYSGGMVPDVSQLVVKGCGIFTNPHGGVAAPARLRLLYEAIPAAFIVEKAGGASSNGAKSLLDVLIEDTDQRTQVALGSREEVKRFDDLVGAAVGELGYADQLAA